MKKFLYKALSFIPVVAIVSSIAFSGTTTSASTQKTGMWLKGDFHTHTYLSDGSYTSQEVAAKAKQFGLDWYSATDHGGGSTGKRNQNGLAWATGTANLVSDVMPRWATISGIGEDLINENRENILQFSGFEWNVPTHEHASVGIVGDSATIKNDLAKFDYIYDSSKEVFNNTNTLFTGVERAMDGKTEMKMDSVTNTLVKGDASKFTYSTHSGAVAGARYLAANFPTTSYFLPNHPSRALNFAISDFKEFYDEAPQVAFGAELLPGHQASAYRGGLGYMTMYNTITKKNVNISYYAGITLATKLDSYIATQATADQAKYTAEIKTALIESITNNIPKQRTYGGADFLLAKIGGGWDTMLTEGRRFWIFGNSDFHIDSEKVNANLLADPNYAGEPDFWPGEYSKNYTYTYGKDYQSILDGMRSGNSFTTLGDLINALDFKVTNNTASATMGETLNTINGKETVITIRFMSPDKNNNNAKPVVDHIDLIRGEVKGEPLVKYVDSSKTSLTSFEDPKQYLTAEYRNDDVTSTTSVIKTFNKSEFTTDKDGYSVITFKVPSTDKDVYYRLRGTNNAIGAGSDNINSNGNPTIDTPANVLTGDNTVSKAFNDLWFYSNPVFVNKSDDGVTINGILKDSTGEVFANTTIDLNSDELYTTKTDSNGKFTLNNVKYGINTLDILDSEGNIVKQLTFNIQEGDFTEFNLGDVWIAKNVHQTNMAFTTNDDSLVISSISELVNSTPSVTPTMTSEDGNQIPETSDNNNLLLYIITLISASGLIINKVRISRNERKTV